MSLSRKPAPKSSRGAKNYWCPHPDKIWAVGEVQSEDKAKKTVKLSVKEDKAVSDYPVDSCILIEDNSIITEEVDDLVSLSQVNDATILNCSRIRFNKSNIYTSIGAVLMAVNPFERIEGLYGQANIAKYHWHTRDSSLPPHIYLTPAGAFKAMASFGKNQSLIISGESGAG
jgi:myosin V